MIYRKKTHLVLMLALLSLLVWSCSSAPKPAQEPLKPKVETPAQGQARNASPARQDGAADKSVIPPEEKRLEIAGFPDKTAQEKDETTVPLDHALRLYEDAKQTKESGDLVAALRMLDEAYGIILKVRIPADSPLLQDKDNLRLLIAQRIQEIYAVRRNPVNGNGKAIPLAENKWVDNEVKLFTGVERKAFEEAYRRSGLYREWIQAELRKAGMPEELCWLPVIESWFQPRALSVARALGMWQFIPSTGYIYGLSQDRFVDDRMDPFKSTKAAIKFLQQLHSFFGDWLSALAAYNCGEGAVQRAIAAQNISYLDNFWDLFQRLPNQTARFVPRFIAAVSIIKDPAKYGMTLPAPYPPLAYDVAKINKPTKLSALAKALGIETSDLTFLNPELRQDLTPDREYELRVPVGFGEKALQAIAAIPKYLPPEFDTYVVRSGDTLAAIARKLGTSVQTIIQVNGLKSNYLIYPGQALKIPRRGA
jgi:membrane-bound lytic murein transglycosylase D